MLPAAEPGFGGAQLVSLLAPQPLPPRTRQRGGCSAGAPSPHQGNEPAGTCTASLVGQGGGGGESCRGKAASPRLAMPAPSRADGAARPARVAAEMACVGTPGVSLVNLPGAAGWPPSHPLLAWPVLPARPAFAGRPACPVCARSVPAGAVDALGISPGDRYRPRLQRLRLRGLH